jgi:hypothetical protein
LADLDSVEFDIYKNIHKGIRSVLFDVTERAGNVDPASEQGVRDVADRWRGAVELLISHAEHEDTHLQPVIVRYLPDVAEKIAYDHPRLEAQMASLEVVADRAVNAVKDARRRAVHRLYLGLATFTSEYLAHQNVEELQVMPGLSAVLGAPELFAIDQAIVASIPPDEVAKALSVMLPAMNTEDRVEMLGGMKEGAPPEVIAGVTALAQTVLAPADFDTLATRLGIA